MSNPKQAPYGTWRSPITSDLIVSGSRRLGNLVLDGSAVYWTEMRPQEQGRTVIVRHTPDGQTQDMLPAPFNARTRVHEYGGAPFFVHQGTIYFSNFADQRLYRVTPGGAPQPVTADAPLRYAAGLFDPHQGRILCVREDHRQEGQEPTNALVSIDPQDGSQTILATGHDFYGGPRLSPQGTHLAWLTWDHPRMPWDGSELWVSPLPPHPEQIDIPQKIAGGPDESLFQPQWAPDGTLYFISDRSGWWNPYRWQHGTIEALCPMEAEFGMPQWVFGMSTYAFLSAQKMICTYTQNGVGHLAYFDIPTRTLSPIDSPSSEFSSLRATTEQAVYIAQSPSQAATIVARAPSDEQTTILRRANTLEIDTGYLAAPEPITFPTEHDLTAHAYFYAPQNKDYVAPQGTLPPLIVISHGGPTASTSTGLNLKLQYWTSRGFAVLDVDYGGSTGYGRDYRQRLDGQWGVVDVDDCANGARYLAEQGRVAPQQLIIRGSSAGGYTTLSALTFRDVFKAGASYYGISDLEALTQETHKFEAHYLDRLIGPYPERRDLYLAHSPIRHPEGLSCPIIFFQGLEDRVVPPNQAAMMVDVLREKGLPVAYVTFEGEQHGFRQAETIKRALDAERFFYARIFGFELPDPVETVKIDNAPNDSE